MRLTNAGRTAPPTGDARGNEPTEALKAAGDRPRHWRPDIEGLRAVAVGAVIAAHIGFFHSEGGFIGVDVFFVISGFLITSLLLREIDRTGRVSIAGFYARRAVRLLPAAVVVLLATLAASWIWLPRTRLGSIALDAAAAALNVVNFRLAQTDTDYLNATAEPSPLQHFWSLAVEEQFYLVWPLLLLAVALLARRVWGGRFAPRDHLRRRRTAAIAAVLALIAAGSFLLSVTRSGPDPVWSYFGIHTRAWELAAGALVAVAASRLRRVPGPLAAAASWAGLAVIVASVFVIDERTVFPGAAAALPVAGTALVIAAGCAPHRFGATVLLGAAPAQYIGKISYGLYLWHWPLVMIGPRILGIEEPRLRDYLLLMGIAFLLTVATFHLVENPVRTRRPLVQVPSRALAMGGGLITAALAVSLVAVVQPLPTATESRDAVEIDGDEVTVWDLINDASETDTVPANLTPSLEGARLDGPVINGDGCQTDRDSVEVKSDCWYGDPEGEKTIVLLGDSHAAQWLPALNQLAEASGWRILALVKANCSIPDVTEFDVKLEREYTECPVWKEGVFDLLEEVRPEAVLTASYDNKEVIADDPDQAWIDGWVASVERLQDVADEVYYMADSIVLDQDPPSCLADNPDDVGACVGDLDESVFKPDRRDEVIEAVSDTGAQVIDPIPWVCDMEQGTCPVVVGNLLIYRDSNHLSASFVAELAPQLASALPLETTAGREADSQ